MDQCRICLEDDEISNMISPCLCRGHMKYIHRNCLNQWRALSDLPNSDDTCPTCKFKYKFEALNQECGYCSKKIDWFINFITDGIFGFLIFNQIVIFLIYLILIQFNGDEKTIINEDLGLSIEKISIATFFTLGSYFIAIVVHFIFQRNKCLFCKRMKSIKYSFFLIICGIGFILSELYIVGLLVTSTGTQFFIKKYIEMVRSLQTVSEINIISLDDDQISLLNNDENRNINIHYEEIELEEII
jgi:hypothetical protein